MNIRMILAASTAMLATAPLTAAPFQDVAALDARLRNALGAGIGEPGGAMAPIDKRLKLSACPQSVQIDAPAMGAVALRCPAAGWRIRVPLLRLAGSTAAGGAAVMQTAKEEPVVRRGDPVDLVADTPGFSVSVSAIAQEDGAPGARIRVKSDNRGQPVFAEVLDAGRVRLPGFK